SIPVPSSTVWSRRWCRRISIPPLRSHPNQRGRNMAVKLTKDTFPPNTTAADFQCFGPPATRDGDFETVKICDMGCFTQDGKDSNKFYHGAVVQHKKSKKWYAYFEWGRTGAAKPSFQFVACDTEADAQREFASQLHSKNDRRGEWASLAG